MWEIIEVNSNDPTKSRQETVFAIECIYIEYIFESGDSISMKIHFHLYEWWRQGAGIIHLWWERLRLRDK